MPLWIMRAFRWKKDNRDAHLCWCHRCQLCVRLGQECNELIINRVMGLKPLPVDSVIIQLEILWLLTVPWLMKEISIAMEKRMESEVTGSTYSTLRQLWSLSPSISVFTSPCLSLSLSPDVVEGLFFSLPLDLPFPKEGWCYIHLFS